MTLDERLVDLLMQAEDLRERGVRVTAAELCRACPELAPALERLLRGTDEVERLMDPDRRPAAGSSPTPPPTSPEAASQAPGISAPEDTFRGPTADGGARSPAALPRVAGYELLQELGRGGMGVVYRARHLALKRTVALKMILAGGHADAAERHRFHAEAEAVARLSHPNIVQLYEVGDSDGLPFCALEYVEGESLARRLSRGPLPPKTAARLLELLAGAMHLAHSRNLVHRDLKPANVLLTGDSTPKITDFGLARRLDAETVATQAGAIVGTPAYMAPEQASGESQSVGPASDVYALGAILYEALTGRPPFHGPTPLHTLEQVRTREPVPPRRVRRAVPADLETVCLKCLRKQPERRYASARELADDLGRFLRGEPVAARPAGAAERLGKWARRRPALATAYVLAMLVLVLGGLGAGAGALWRRAEQAREQLAEEKRLTEAALRRETDAREAEVVARHGEREANDRLQDALYYRRVAAALAEWRDSESSRAEQALAECPPERRGWEWHYVNQLCRTDRRTLSGFTGCVRAVAFSPYGGRLAAAGDDGTIRLWDTATWQESPALRGHTDHVLAVAFSPDGSRLASASADRTVRLWDAQTGAAVRTFSGHAGAVRGVAFGPGGETLASAAADGTVRVWDVATGEARLTLRGRAGGFTALALSPDGRRLAAANLIAVRGVGHTIGSVTVWDARTGREERSLIVNGSGGRAHGLAFSPDGKRLSACSPDMAVHVYDAATGREEASLPLHDGGPFAVAYSPDGKRLAVASEAGSLTLWDPARQLEVLTRKGSLRPAHCVTFSPDGALLAGAYDDGTVKVWGTAPGAGALVLRRPDTHVFGVAFSPDGARLASARDERTVDVWDVATGRPAQTLEGHRNRVRAVAFSPDGRRLASASMDRTVKVWDARTGEAEFVLAGHTNAITHVTFSPDGSRLASCSDDQTVRVWGVASRREELTLLGHTNRVWRVAFSPDGTRLASASADRTVRVWDLDTGQAVLVFRGHSESAHAVAFSPDGGRVASGSRDDTVKVWDARTGQEALTLRGHAATVAAVAFSPDGTRLATGSWDDTVKLWDARTGQEALTLTGHVRPVWDVCFSPDGRRLASASGDGTVRVWDAGSRD